MQGQQHGNNEETAPPRVRVISEFARKVIQNFLNRVGKGGGSPQDELLRGFKISTERVAQQLMTAHPDLVDEGDDTSRLLQDEAESWISSPPQNFYGVAELGAMFKLTADDLALFAMAAAPGVEPDVADLYAYVWDNVHKRTADVGFICRVLASGNEQRFERLLRRMAYDAPLRRHRLLLVEDRQSSDDSLELNLVERRVRAADRVLEYLRYAADNMPPVDESLAATCVRLTEKVRLDVLRHEDHTHDALLQIIRTKNLPLVLEGPEGAGKQKTTQAIATMLDRNVVSADLTALLTLAPDTLEARLSEIFREARLGQDLLYFRGYDLPEQVPGPLIIVLQRMLEGEPLVLGVERLPIWAVMLTQGWPVVPIPLPPFRHRADLWRQAFEGERRAPDDDAIEVVARRYEMSAAQIHQAAGEARRRAQVARRRHVELSDMDKACRAHFAHQLSELASLIPPASFSAEDLILPDNEKRKFEEILLYSREHDTIYSDWGFAEKFPYGRGLSVLFYGPPGTGKTMAACIIANVLGLDLYRVDLSRIMSRYVGETEKNLARVFDEAERGRVMLLFDEADALFTKRTQVKSSVDRYANLEVAYLLQRMENFEGVTVLTTNVEANLDDAFKRRIRYRVYFPMPDAETRGQLWSGLIPKRAPLKEGIPFDLLGEHYEISGGHIKQAVLRAAFYARRAETQITFEHLLEAGRTECRELGMLMSDRVPKQIARALRIERGEPEPPDDDDMSPRVAG